MKNNIKTATIISYITLIAGNVISIVYTPIMLTTLGRGEYGLFTLVNTIISYIYLLDMGLGNAVIRYNSKYMAENNEQGLKKINGMFLVLYCIIAVLGIIIGILIYFNLGNIFSNGLNITEIQQIKLMFIVALVNLAFAFPLNVFSGIIMANERFIFTKVLALIRAVLNPIIMVSVLALGQRALGMLIASTIFNILLGIANIIYCFKILKIKMKFLGFDEGILAEIFRYSFFIFLSAIAYRIYWSTDQFILGMFVGAAPIAIYSIGSQFNGYFISFSNVISNMFLPKLTKLATEENKKELMNILVKISRIQFFIASFILIGFILVGKQFILIWAGEGYELSYYIAILLMVPQIFSIIQSLFATMLEAMSKHRVKALIYLGVAIFNLVLSLFLVQILGSIGCALGTAIGMTINSLLNNWYYKFKLNLDMAYYWKNIISLAWPATLCLVLGYMLIRFINPIKYIGILLFAIIFSIAYLLIFWILALNKYEKSLIKSVFMKFKSKLN
ncbi:oligosaccharide flippase family protein [Clostridium chromiireducens]|uniref:Oligosaccharide flippase family protein n=1 Tax=Clostridium chromiireducens TaxID=225345 RepID=A0A964RK41_9CLOT|nr:oligosaccharide flippase family protein [Clostridium chromiireducens]MVX63208.1 oligosaccharide flippase family protein [Clostridium chromiireducens]